MVSRCVGASFRPAFFALVFGALVFLWNLNYAPLWNPDEGRYASAALEMAQPAAGTNADWIVPHLNGVPRLNKPPLIYWLGALSLKLFGKSEGSARLPSALAAIGVLLLLWHAGGKLFDAKTGVLASLIWATSFLPFVLARVINTDLLLTFSIALALFASRDLLQNKPAPLRNVISALLAALGFGMAILTKGPIGLALPLVALFIWQVSCGFAHWRALSSGNRVLFFVAPLGGVLLALPWYVAVARVHPEFLRAFLLGENWARFAGSHQFHRTQPFWYYAPVILLGLLPWTGWLLPALRLARETNAQKQTATYERRFLWAWALVVVIVFSISKVKLITYILPAFPALALLVADAIRHSFTQEKLAARWSTLVPHALLAIIAIVALASGKVLPGEEVKSFIGPLCLVLVAGFFALWRLSTSWRPAPIAVGAAMAFGLYAVLLPLAGRIATYRDASSLIRATSAFASPSDIWLQRGAFSPTGLFYAAPRQLIAGYKNTSGLDEATLKASPYFIDDDKELLKRMQSDSRRVWVLTKNRKRSKFLLETGWQVIARNDNFQVLTNRPLAAGLVLEALTHPDKRYVESKIIKAPPVEVS